MSQSAAPVCTSKHSVFIHLFKAPLCSCGVSDTPRVCLEVVTMGFSSGSDPGKEKSKKADVVVCQSQRHYLATWQTPVLCCNKKRYTMQGYSFLQYALCSLKCDRKLHTMAKWVNGEGIPMVLFLFGHKIMMWQGWAWTKFWWCILICCRQSQVTCRNLTNHSLVTF